MIEKLEHKIDEVLDYIINKPADRITPEDFAIMAGELKERRFRESSKQQRDKSNHQDKISMKHVLFFAFYRSLYYLRKILKEYSKKKHIQ